MRARDIVGALGDYVDSVAGNFTFPAVQPMLVLVDGLDEIGRISAKRILDDAVPFVEANQNMSMVFTARPLTGIEAEGHRVEIPHLEEEGILSLVSKVAGRTVEAKEMWGWSESVRDVARRPLFSVMIGAMLREGSHVLGTRPIDLVTSLANRALYDAGSQGGDIDLLLQTLAVKAVGSSASVPKSDVSPNRWRQDLLAASRLVSDESGSFDFTLPIFREWFAARALVEETVSLKELLPLAGRWEVPLAIAINSENRSIGESLMGTLARSDPGMAGLVLQESEDIRDWDTAEKRSLGTADEAGSQVRQAMEDWHTGIGVLMSEIGPVTDDGSISTLGIGVSNSWVTTSWYHGTEQMPPVVPIPERDGSLSRRRDWPSVRSTSVLPERVWPWVITKGDLAATLSRKLASRRLALISNDAIRELAYDFAYSVGRQRWPRTTEVTIGEVVSFIDSHIERGTVSLGIAGTVYKSGELSLVRSHLAELLEGGEQFISDPWPGPDRTRPLGGSRWGLREQFTDQRLVERTQAVYAAARRIYADMVRTWFQAFDNRLRLMRLLPVKLMGLLAIPQAKEGHVRPTFPPEAPILIWWPQPIDEHEGSQVAFELDPQTASSREEARLSIDSAQKESYTRTDEYFWEMTALHVFDSRPATEMAHSWLIGELRRTGWTNLLG